MKTKFFVCVLVLTLLFFMAGCGNNAVQEPAEPEPAAQIEPKPVEDLIEDQEEDSEEFVYSDELTEDKIVAWALGCSAILAKYRGFEPHQFGMFEVNETNKTWAEILLEDSWGCYSREDVIYTLETMTDGGHNSEFALIYDEIDKMSDEEFKELVDSSEGIDIYMWPLTKDLGEKWGDKQLKAWDWYRMIHITGWAYVAGHFTLEESYGYMVPVIERLRDTFSSWDEANENYMDGYAWWSRVDISDPVSSLEYRERLEVLEELKSYPADLSFFDPTLWPGYVPSDNPEGSAPEDSYKKNYKYDDNGDGTCTITGYTWDRGDLIIPDEIDGLKVAAIGEKAFYSAKGFTGKLVIADGVKTIGDYAFQYCTGLTGSLIIPNSVTYIGRSAFSDCTGFTGDLTLSNSVKEISNSAFNKCSGFKGKLTIPEGVAEIGDSAFIDCSGFTGSLILPKSLTRIGKSSFYNCSGFTGTVMIPENVTAVYNVSFNKCFGITAIEVSDKNREFMSVDGVLFTKDQKRLIAAAPGMKKNNYSVPAGTVEIDVRAFDSCKELTGTLKIPEGVEKIGGKAFEGCSGLEAIQLPMSVKDLGGEVFNGCSKIKRIVIPEGVTKVNGGMFKNCDSLEEVEFLGNAPEKAERNIFDGSTNKNVKIIYNPRTKGWSTPTWNGWACYPK